MAVLDQLLERDQREQDTQLAQASHDFDWKSTFASTPPTEVLRAGRNVTDLMSQALERKAQLIAQTDSKAMDIYATGRKLDEFQRQAPLRERLLEAQIESEGATARFKQKQEADTMTHISGFMDHMVNSPDVGSPEYQKHVLQGLRQYPLAATTQIGKEMLKNVAESHDVAVQLGDLSAPQGMAVSSVTMGKRGVQQATFRPADDKNPRKAFYEEVKGLNLSPYAFENSEAWKTDPKSGKRFYQDQTTKQPITLDPEHFARLKEQYDALHQNPREAVAAAPVPKHLGKFNPKTGEFE